MCGCPAVQSADNYYGDSHVYFMTSDGRIATGLAPTKKGPVFDIAWGMSHAQRPSLTFGPLFDSGSSSRLFHWPSFAISCRSDPWSTRHPPSTLTTPPRPCHTCVKPASPKFIYLCPDCRPVSTMLCGKAKHRNSIASMGLGGLATLLYQCFCF